MNGNKYANSLLDPRSIAKHYTVKSTSLSYQYDILNLLSSPNGQFDDKKSGIKRHYTEAFCMRPDVYQALLDLANNNEQEKAAETIINAIKAGNNSDLHLTIKGYTQNEGLSKFIHEDLN